MRRKSHITCALTAASVFATLLLTWRTASASMTPPPEHPRQLDSTMLWLDPGRLPLEVLGDLAAARTVVIGDSRVMKGLRREIVDRAGLGPTCVVWRGGAYLPDLMEVLEGEQIETVVVALSPLSVAPYQNRIMQELVRAEAPVFEPGKHTAATVFEWMRAEEQHLLQKGFPAFTIGLMLAKLKLAHDREAKALSVPGSIDRALARSLTSLRFEVCMPVRTGLWNKSWLPIQNEERSNRTYRSQLSRERYKNAFQASADATARRMAELSERVNLIAVRLPISASLREVEDGAVAPERIAAIAASAGVPFIDFGTSPHTSDGSHLDTVGSKQWTLKLIAELKQADR